MLTLSSAIIKSNKHVGVERTNKKKCSQKQIQLSVKSAY